MTCYHPLKGFILNVRSDGKKDIKVCSYDVQCVWKRVGEQVWHKESYVVSFSLNLIIVTDFIQVPCGQCYGCRLQYSREWANRCMLEASEYSSNFFLTLTYDDEHLPWSSYFDKDTGELLSIPTLKNHEGCFENLCYAC